MERTTTTTATTTTQATMNTHEHSDSSSQDSSENFPEDFFKLSRLKFLPKFVSKQTPKNLIKQLTELEAKCRRVGETMAQR